MRSSAASSTVTMRSLASMHAASAPSSDVLPLDVPPLITIERRERTQRSSNSASASESEPSSTSSPSVNGRGANRRSVSSGPSGASGGSTTFSREPSARRASTIGWASSSRRPARAARRTQASRSALASSKRNAARCSRPRRSIQISAGPFAITSVMLGSLSSAASGSGRAATESAPAGLSSAAAALSCARSQRLIARSARAARAANARAGRRQTALTCTRYPRVRLHRREQRQACLHRERLRGLRLARARGDDARQARREPEPRDQQRCAPRAAGSASIRARDDDDEARALEHGDGLDSDPGATVDDRAQTARDGEVEHARNTPLVDQIGVLGQRRRGQHAACRRPARVRPSSSAGAATGPQAIRRSASGTATMRGRHLGGIARRERQIEHEGTLVGGSERHRAGRGAHAAAGADQGDVALVTESGRRAARVERTRCSQSLTEARRVDGPFDDPDRATIERLLRSALGAFRCDQEDARLRAPGTLAAHEIARSCVRGVGSQEHVGIGSVSRREQSELGQAGERGAELLGQGRVASEQSNADDHEPSPRRSRRTSRPPRPVARASATADGARRVTEMPPERSLAGESNSSPRAATREPRGPRITTSTNLPRCSSRVSGADPDSSSSATARSPAPERRWRVIRAQRTAHEKVATGQADECAASGQTAERADHRRRAVCGGDRHDDDIAGSHDGAGGQRVPERQHRRSGARRLRGAVQG